MVYEELDRFERLFTGREKVHGRFRSMPDGGKRVRTVKRPVVTAEYLSHLDGVDYGLGIVPIREDNTCLFGAVDVDDMEIDHHALATKVHELGLPLIVCRSRSGGAHLYLFLRDPTPASLIIERLLAWAKALRVKNTAAHGLEIFPKQAKAPKGAIGSWINLPYHNAQDTLRYAVSPAGEHLALDAFVAYAERMSVTADELQDWQVGHEPEGEMFSDGPPCLQTLHQMGVSAGSRNMALFNIALYMKHRYPDAFAEPVRAYNAMHIDPPLSKDEVASTIGSVREREYVYKGNDIPIRPFCCQGDQPALKKECARRKFGCRAGLQGRLAEGLANLRKVLTEPVAWIIEVDGVDISLDTASLLDSHRFRQAVLERKNVIYPRVKSEDWDGVIKEMLVNVTEIDAPEEASVTGAFRELLYEFLEFRRQAQRVDDLLLGRPVEQDGVVLFRASDLMEHLSRRRFNDFDRGAVWRAVHNLGGDRLRVRIQGAHVRVWSLPLPKEEQDEPFTIPDSDAPDF